MVRQKMCVPLGSGPRRPKALLRALLEKNEKDVQRRRASSMKEKVKNVDCATKSTNTRSKVQQGATLDDAPTSTMKAKDCNTASKSTNTLSKDQQGANRDDAPAKTMKSKDCNTSSKSTNTVSKDQHGANRDDAPARTMKAKDDVAVKKVDRTKDDPNSDFLTQCRPNGLFDLIASLNDQQRKDVADIGFGGLLQLRLTKCFSQRMLKWLVDHFNGSSRMLALDTFRKFSITADDVYDIFMVPRNEGHDVPCYSRSDVKTFQDTFSEKFGIKNRDPIYKLPKIIAEQLSGGGDDFKRIFVLYSLCSFLYPSSNRLVNLAYLKALEVVEDIPKFDWCTMILQKLSDSVLNYHNKGMKNISGCVILLQLVYMHRLKWRGRCEPTTIPLIQHWTDQKMKSRCDQEDNAKEFGSGELVVGVYPLTENGVLKTSPSASDAQADNSYQDIKDLLASFHKDAREFSDKYLLKLMTLLEDLHPPGHNTQPDQTPPNLSNTQKFFMNKKLHNYVDYLGRYVTMMKQMAAEAPNFNLLSPEPVFYETNLSGNPEDEFDAQGFDVDLGCQSDEFEKQPAPASALSDAVKSVGTKRKSVGNDVGHLFWMINDDIGHLSKLVTSNKKLYYHLPQTHLEVVDFCFFKGDSSINVEHFYRFGDFIFITPSDLMSLMPNVHIYLPIVTAWSLEVNNDIRMDNERSRFIFNFEHSNCLRKIVEDEEDIETFVDEFYFGWNQWMKDSRVTSLLVDMIFVPFCLGDHYAMIAINFPDGKLHYLDNLKNVNENGIHVQAAKILGKLMANFLDSKGHPKAKAISSYNFEIVKMKWQTGKRNLDCGVYMMHLMKHFNGVPYTTIDLNKPDVRQLIRAEICAVLILSNFNQVRADIIQKVFNFYMNEKPALIEKLKAEKKENAEKQKEKKRKNAAEMLNNIREDLGRGKRRL